MCILVCILRWEIRVLCCVVVGVWYYVGGLCVLCCVVVGVWYCVWGLCVMCSVVVGVWYCGGS